MQRIGINVGINAYEAISQLACCVDDAKRVRGVLEGLDYDIIFSQYDAAATQEAITGLLEKTIRDAAFDDVIFWSYSGHGTPVPDLSGDELDRKDEAICPVDMHTSADVIKDDWFHSIIVKHLKCRLIMLFDSCNSGSMARNPMLTARFVDFGVSLRKTWRDLLLFQFPRGAFCRALAKTGKRVTALYAAQPSQYSYEGSVAPGVNAGFFTYHVTEVVKANPGMSYSKVLRRVRRRFKTKLFRQYPYLGGDKNAAFGA